MEGEETFDSSFLGHADEVVEERIADDDVILVKGTKNTSAVCTFSRLLEYMFRPMRLRPMWPMYGNYIATLLGLAK
jgi:hypothetical protein